MFEGWCATKILWSAISVDTEDGESPGNKDSRVIDVLDTTEAPENGHTGVRTSSLKKIVGSIAQLKCNYTNAYSVVNKQEELEATVQLENYDIVAITESWWDDLHNQSAAMDGYKCFRRGSPVCWGVF